MKDIGIGFIGLVISPICMQRPLTVFAGAKTCGTLEQNLLKRKRKKLKILL